NASDVERRRGRIVDQEDVVDAVKPERLVGQIWTPMPQPRTLNNKLNRIVNFRQHPIGEPDAGGSEVIVPQLVQRLFGLPGKLETHLPCARSAALLLAIRSKTAWPSRASG